MKPDQYKTNLSSFDNSWFDPGGSGVKRMLWYCTNICFFLNPFVPFYGLKVFFLRLFGANVGRGVVIKPAVNIKYPWNLKIGNDVWIGEKVWIDCLGQVKIGDNVCISQGALILSGNHDYKKTTFNLIVKNIIIEEGSWIGARAVVCQGVKCGSHSILTVGSVATKNMDPYSIYQGIPAVKVRERKIRAEVQ